MQPGHLQVPKKVKFKFSLRVASVMKTIIQSLALIPSITSSPSAPHTTTTMKPSAVILIAVSALCLATEERSSTETSISSTQRLAPSSTQRLAPSSTPRPVNSASRKPELVSKRLEQKQSEGRARMEVSDAQLEMALKDKRYLQRQLKCTLGEAPCDPVGRRLRTLAPLVVRGSCPQCTPTEMRQIQKVLLHMQRNFPKEWARIVRTYQ